MSIGKFLSRRCHLPGVAAVEAETDHVFPKHTHEEFGIGVIALGAQTSLSGRGVVDAGPGDVITVNPGEVHDGAPIGDHGRAWKMLYFDPGVIFAVAGDITENTHCQELRFPVLRDRLMAAWFIQLYGAATDDDSQGLGIGRESLLLLLVNRLISEKTAEAKENFPQSLRRAKSLIDDSPTDNLTLADMARASGLSRFQVLRGLTTMTGMTPHAYLMQKRVDLARRLIREGLALADAAAASGFADQSHMTRAFASRYGVTPGAYAAATA